MKSSEARSSAFIASSFSTRHSSICFHHLRYSHEREPLVTAAEDKLLHRIHREGAIHPEVTVAAVVQQNDVAALHATHHLVFDLGSRLCVPVPTAYAP